MAIQVGTRVRVRGKRISNGSEEIDAIGSVSHALERNGGAIVFDVALERYPYGETGVLRDLRESELEVLDA
jgi:hypothetical protein